MKDRMKDLSKIKKEMQTVVIGAKNKYFENLESSKICTCGNRKLAQSKTCQKCYLKSGELNQKGTRRTQEFKEIFRQFVINSKNNKDGMYTIVELAEIFNMSEPSIYGYIQRLNLKPYIKSRNRGRPRTKFPINKSSQEFHNKVRWGWRRR